MTGKKLCCKKQEVYLHVIQLTSGMVFFMDDRFIKPIAAGEIVAIIAVSNKDPTGDIAAQSAYDSERRQVYLLGGLIVFSRSVSNGIFRKPFILPRLHFRPLCEHRGELHCRREAGLPHHARRIA